MLSPVITSPALRGIFRLSSRGILPSSARVAARAPPSTRTGFPIHRRPKIRQLTKQARLPSRLLLIPRNLRFPRLIPTKAAKVSPMERKAMEHDAISGSGKKATQSMAENNRYVAPVKSFISCLRRIMPKSL